MFFHTVRRMTSTGAAFLRGMMTRTLLLLSLLLAGMVPDGMMRQAGPDGMRLVLCTSEGTQEVWLTDDGEVIPVEEGQDHQPGEAAHTHHCVQVNMIAQAAALPEAAPREIRMGRIDRAAATHQVPARRSAGDDRRTRAPPIPV